MWPYLFVFLAVLTFGRSDTGQNSPPQPPARSYRDTTPEIVQNPRPKVSAISLNGAATLFKRFQSETSIPHHYPVDGCYARATAMARIAQKMNLYMGKVFTTGRLQVKTGNPAYPVAQWAYHVAPIIDVRQKDGRVMKMVFDPSLFDRPVSITEWNNRMLDQVPESENGFTPRIEQTFFSTRFQYSPDRIGPDDWSPQVLEHVEKTFVKYRPLERKPVTVTPVKTPNTNEGLE